MRDPLTWSFPMGRLFGINIRVHLLFPLVALGMVLRVAYQKDVLPGLWIEACILMGLLFFSVLLHEFGHCFGARAVDGDAQEVLLWPLGGLAFTEVPHTPRANFITTAAGPAVNVLICLAVCLLLAPFSLTPSFKPWSDPYLPVVYDWSQGTWYGSKTGRGDLWKFTGYKNKNKNDHWENAPEGAPSNLPSGFEPVKLSPDEVTLYGENNFKKVEKRPDGEQSFTVTPEPIPHSFWLVLLCRIFWVNWFLFLLNLLPGFPLDGGRILQSIWWWRSDYRQGTQLAIYAGFVVMLLLVLMSIIIYEPLVLCLAIFIYVACRRQWLILETGGDESLFGYDFSQGYTSLERDQPPPPPRRRPNWWQRWLQRRAERRIRREQEQREAEEQRMDELLQKVQQVGLHGLTDEERRFLTRVSAKYRHRQQ
jgi:Zn-dependent protease